MNHLVHTTNLGRDKGLVLDDVLHPSPREAVEDHMVLAAWTGDVLSDLGNYSPFTELVIGVVRHPGKTRLDVDITLLIGEPACALVVTLGDHVRHDVDQVTSRGIDLQFAIVRFPGDPSLCQQQDMSRVHAHGPLDGHRCVLVDERERDRHVRQQQRLLGDDHRKK